MADNDGLDWLSDPSTVNPQDYLQRMAEADSKPGDAIKRARSNLSYALKKGRILLAPTPFPKGHVFTDEFYRWLLKKYPRIHGIHPHYGRTQIAIGCTARWSNAVPPPNPSSPLTLLQQENQTLKARIATLEQQLEKANQEKSYWQERDEQRRRNCGRRPLTEKINS